MKRVSLYRLALVAAGLSTFATGALGAPDPGVSIVSSSADRTVIAFDVSDFTLRDVDVNGSAYSAIVWDGGVTSQVRGEPALPGFRASIVIPDDAEMTLRVVESEYVDYPDVAIVPSKGPITRDILPQKVPYVFSDVYTRDAYTPSELAALGEPYILRDVRGLVVAVSPFRWNPVSRTLRVFTHVVVEVSTAGPGKMNVLTRRPESRALEFERIYAEHFINYGTTNRYSTVGEAGKMLVIAYDAFMDATQPLVDWKNQMGVETEMVPISTIGTTGNQLRSYCQSRYDTDGICFYLLVGDGPQIPYLVNNDGAADPVLTLCAGGDSYPDAFVGRISAQNVAEVATQVERIVEYERDPDPNGRWYARGISIASNEGQGYGDDGEADWEHARNYRRDLLGFTYPLVDELYDGTHPAPPAGEESGQDAPGDPTSSQVAALVNDGRGLIHYTGHGSTSAWATTGFSSSTINGLTNDNRLPMVVSVGCVNGSFEGTTCFAETWLRATHDGEPTGAVACYASTVNQQWATPMRAQDEMIDLLTTNQKRTWGGICFNGSCDMIDHYGSDGISEFKNWTIFGDPSIRIRTARPASLTVSHAGAIDPELNVFQVLTEPDALVGLSHDGVFIASAFADGSGMATVPYDPADLTGLFSVVLTVTAFNAVPDVEDLPVADVVAVGDGSAAGLLRPQGRPNPFRASTTISFELDAAGETSLDIFDAMGRHVRTVASGMMPAGIHALAWDGRDDRGHALAPGTYFYRLVAGTERVTRSVVLLR